jgi:N-acetylneuraminic acid mutarotase
MQNMNKIFTVILLFFFISGIFVVAFSPVPAVALVENFWNKKAPMSTTRIGLGVVAVDGKVYAIGGFTKTGYLGINERYDPVSDKWVTLASMPTPRNDFTIAACDGKIYCMGGITNVGKDGVGKWFRCDVVEAYDTVTDSWSTKTSLPFNGSGFQAHAIDGKIFIIMKPYLYIYDPIADSWTKKASFSATPVSWVSFVLTAADDKLVVIGEFPVTGSPSVSNEQRVMIYDPKTDVWSEGASSQVEWFSGVIGVTSGVYAPQRVYFFGKNSTVVYDPVNNVWSTASSMRTPRAAFGVAVVDDIFYVVGGSTPNTAIEFLSVNEQYIPVGYHGTMPTVTPPSSSSTPESSKPTSEQSDFAKSYTRLFIIVAALALTVGIVVTSLVFYSKKSKESYQETL